MSCHVMTWKSMSWHGSLCHDIDLLFQTTQVFVMTWKSISWHGSLYHDMEVFVMTWKSLSWHRPVSSKSDIQKSPITKKCMVVKGLRNPIEWPYKLTKIDESRFVGSSISPRRFGCRWHGVYQPWRVQGAAGRTSNLQPSLPIRLSVCDLQWHRWVLPPIECEWEDRGCAVKIRSSLPFRMCLHCILLLGLSCVDCQRICGLLP